MFVYRYLKQAISSTPATVPNPAQAEPPPTPRRPHRRVDMAAHPVLTDATPLVVQNRIFQPPAVAPVIAPRVAPVPAPVPRDAAAVREAAGILCRKLIAPAAGEIVDLSALFREMPADVGEWFMQNRTTLLARMNDPQRTRGLTKVDILILLVGEALAVEQAGAAGGTEVAGTVAKIRAVLQMFVDELAGSDTSVVETDPGFVGETYHILVAAYMRNDAAAPLRIRTPPNLRPGGNNDRFHALVGGVARASRSDAVEIAKADLTPLMLAGDHKRVRRLRDMLLSGLTPDTVTEIRERTQGVLEQAGMAPASPKLGIFIRNVKPDAAAGGTQDPAGNMTRERFLDVLDAARKNGIRDIVLLGDRPDPGWLAGTPWDPAKAQASAQRRKRAGAAADGDDAPYRVADLTEPWVAHRDSPLFDGNGLQGPRWNISTTTAHGSGREGENSLQGGYAEQLAMYDQLHAHLGMVGAVGNRSGVMDGPGFLGVPCVQLVARAPFPQESSLDRLGLLSTIIPSYRILSLETPQAGHRRGAATSGAQHLSTEQADALRGMVGGFRLRAASGAGAAT